MIINGTSYCSLEDLEEDAFVRIEAGALGYLKSGSETETTLRLNREQFSSVRFIPRVLVDVSRVSTESKILGRRVPVPIMIAPMAMQRLVHTDGECAMSRGAMARNVPMILSTMSTSSMQDVAQTNNPNLLFQLYCLKDRDVVQRMVEEAEKLRFKGLVVTVDAPRLGKRESDEKQKFSLPKSMHLEILRMHGITHGESNDASASLQSKFGREFSSLIDDSLTWDIIPWLKSITKLPIIVKGILSEEDAVLAVKHGVDAIVVSNHGGRQLDHAIPTLHALARIAPRIRNKGVEIWVDGGIRRGTDVVKCLCLGADAVLIGRPFLWSLCLGGASGVEEALTSLQQDVERTMALLGCNSTGVDVHRGLVVSHRRGSIHCNAGNEPDATPDPGPVEIVNYGGRLPSKRRLLLSGAAATSVALGGNLLNVTSFLLGLDDGRVAASLRLDVLFPVKGFKRCVDYQNGYEFVYPSSWLADQRLYRRYAQRIEKEKPLDLPPISRQSPRRRIAKYDPSAGFGPPKGNGEDNISVVCAPIMPGFSVVGLGSPDSAAQNFLDNTIAPAGSDKSAKLLGSGSRVTAYGDTVYWFEFTVEKASAWKRHNIAVIGSRDDALYTFNAQCNESRWISLRDSYNVAAQSFQMIPVKDSTNKDFPESL